MTWRDRPRNRDQPQEPAALLGARRRVVRSARRPAQSMNQTSDTHPAACRMPDMAGSPSPAD